MSILASFLTYPFLAQVSIGATPEPPLPPAAIVIYAPSVKGGVNTDCSVNYLGSKLADLESGTYVDWRVPSGLYRFEAGGAHVDVNAEAGIFTYVRCSTESSASGRLKLEVVETGDFGKLVRDLGEARSAMLNLFVQAR